MSYILFYSNKCPHSRKFISILEQIEESNFFAKVCVDKDQNGNRPNVIKKYQISNVPTLIIENNKLSGTMAFKWLDNRIKLKSSRATNLQTRNNKVNIKELNENKSSVVSGFSCEMSKLSSNFAYISEDNAPDNAHSNQYSMYGREYDKIVTKDESENVSKPTVILQDDNVSSHFNSINEDNNKKNNAKSQLFESDLEKLKRERENIDKMYDRRAQRC